MCPAEGLRDMNIPQDVIGNRERWDWMHRAPETPETDYITPKQKRTIRIQQVVFPFLSGLQRVWVLGNVSKTIFHPLHFYLPPKKRIKEEFSSPWLSYNEA